MLWLTEENIHRMESQREMFETLLASKIPTIHINSSGAPRAWTTSSISFPEVKGELMLLMLSEQGVCASSGSACSSGALKGSKVIEAIGAPGDGEWGAVRFSFARTTTEEELTFTVGALVTVVQTIHSIVSAASEPQTN